MKSAKRKTLPVLLLSLLPMAGCGATYVACPNVPILSQKAQQQKSEDYIKTVERNISEWDGRLKKHLPQDNSAKPNTPQ